jgi:low affinity Fe/Cu permease
MTLNETRKIVLEKTAEKATRWIGSTASLTFHTIFFVISFSLPLFKILDWDKMLLVLTTVVSLEAIYLSIFIQMTVNKNSQDIEIIQEDIDEIQEDVDEIQEDIDEIQEDIQEETENKAIVIENKEAHALAAIQSILLKLHREIDDLKKNEQAK